MYRCIISVAWYVTTELVPLGRRISTETVFGGCRWVERKHAGTYRFGQLHGWLSLQLFFIELRMRRTLSDGKRNTMRTGSTCIDIFLVNGIQQYEYSTTDGIGLLKIWTAYCRMASGMMLTVYEYTEILMFTHRTCRHFVLFKAIIGHT